MQATNAKINYSNALEDDPKKASRAVDLAEDSDTPAAVIHGDLENYEKQYRAKLAGGLFDTSPHLSEYINSHPLIPSVVHKDIANIVKAGESFQSASDMTGRPWWQIRPVVIAAAATARGIQMGSAKIASAVGRPIGNETLTGMVARAQRNIEEEIPISKEDEESLTYRVTEGIAQIFSLLPAAAAGGVPGAAVAMGLQMAEDEAEKAIQAGVQWQTPYTGGFVLGSALGMIPFGVLEKFTARGAPGITGFVTQRLKEALATGAAMGAVGELGAAGSAAIERMTFDPEAKYKPDLQRVIASVVGGAILGPTFGTLKSFVDAGVAIPPGAHPLTDAILIEKTKVDNEALDTALKDAAKTTTKELQPKFLAEYYKLKPSATMGLDGDAVAKLLYPEGKLPTPDDKILGWVPNIARQLEAARRDGSDIVVPLPDYVAHVSPEVDKALHDHRRVDGNGLTLDDIKNLYAVPEQPVEGAAPKEPVDLYHGTTEAFDTPLSPGFAKNKYEKAVFFSDKAEKAGQYAEGEGGRMFKVQVDKEDLYHPTQAELEGFMEKGDYVQQAIEKAKELGKKGVHFDLAGEHVYALTDVPTPRLGGLARSGDPTLDAVRRQNGLSGILPMPEVEGAGRYDFTPGKGLLPPGETLSGPAFQRTALGQSYTVLKEAPARDFLRQVDRSVIEGIPRTLFQFFGNRIDKIAGDVPVQVLTRKEMNRIYNDIFGARGSAGAFYWRGSGADQPRIVMPEDLINGQYGHQYAAHVIIHEMAHGATVKAMVANPDLKASLLKLRQETLEWLQKNDPAALEDPGIKYAFHDPDGFEYIAQAYSDFNFQRRVADIPISPDLAKELGHPGANSIWEGARQLIKRALEKIMGVKIPTTVMDGLFSLGERFDAIHDARQPEIGPAVDFIEQPGPSVAERQLFQDQKTLGYTKEHWERIKDKLAKARQEDNEFQQKQAMKDAEQRQTEAWKENSKLARPDAEARVLSRPDISADRFFRLGILNGDKVTRQRIDEKFLAPEIKAQLSPEYYGKKGIDPDQIAGPLGYRSGASMVSDLIALEADRNRQGLTHNAHITKLIDVEVDRMMREKFGSLETQILEDAKDHIINDGQFDLLHEDTLRLATKLGFDATSMPDGKPWTKDNIKAMAQYDLDQMRSGDVKSTRMSDNTGKIGRKIEDAENRGDVKEVLRLAQAREISFYKTKEARDFEKLQKQGDKLFKKHKKIEVPGFKDEDSAAYHDFIQLLLGDVGKTINRRYEDVKAEFEKKGFKDFRSFVENRELVWDETIPAPDFILNGEHKINGKTINEFGDLTVGEASSFINLVKSLDQLGRERLRANREYDSVMLEPVLNAAIGEIERFPVIERKASKGPITDFISRTFHHYDASSRVIERLLNRFDKDNPRGPLNQYVVRPMTEAANRVPKLQRKYGKMLLELGEPPDLNKKLDPPFKVPSTGRDFVDFTNKNKLAIMLNMGSKENWEKFTAGWKADPAELSDWVKSHSTQAEWKWVQGVWDIFSKLKVDLDGVYRRTTGTPPGLKHFTPIDTPFGTFEGGYYPLIHDEIEIGKGSKTATNKVLDGPTFLQTSIPNPHAKPVTGAEYPVSMNLDFMISQLDMMVHDIAFREALHEVKKVLGHKPLRQTIRNHYGLEYDQAIDTWLHDVAHASEYNTAAAAQGERVSQFFRQGVIGYLVGANIGTVLKHGPTAFIMSARRIGTANLMEAYATLFRADPATGDRMWKWISENSEEIQRRDRFWQETYGGVYKDWTQSTVRDHIIQWGAKPVAFSDMISAKPLWLGAFMKATKEGMDFGEARFEADRAVRFAHGSTAITNLPAFVRGDGIHKWYTSLYGFFGTVLQNRMEIAFKVNDAYKLGREGELKQMAKILPLIAADTFAYVIAPTAIEEWVTGLATDDRRGLLQHLAWGTIGGMANSFIYAREIVHMLQYGIDSSGGLLSSAVRPFQKSFNDVTRRGAFSKKHAGDLIDDVLSLAGPFTGLPKEVGNLAKYGWNTMVADIEHPRTGLMKSWHEFGDLGMGIFRGHQKKTIHR
jgi:hypothetical protein